MTTIPTHQEAVKVLRDEMQRIIDSVPAFQDGGFFIEHYSPDGEPQGCEQVDPVGIIQNLQGIADRALAATSQVEAASVPAQTGTGEAPVANLDQLALDTATTIMARYFEVIPGVQLKAKIQEDVRAAIDASRPPAAQAKPDLPGLTDDARLSIERAAEYLEHYVAYVREVKPDDIERHPYLPSVEECAEELRALLAHPVAQAKPEGDA